jgi:hypothetical protein
MGARINAFDSDNFKKIEEKIDTGKFNFIELLKIKMFNLIIR